MRLIFVLIMYPFQLTPPSKNKMVYIFYTILAFLFRIIGLQLRPIILNYWQIVNYTRLNNGLLFLVVHHEYLVR